MADAMMMFLGEAHGVNWYWAQPGEFENPGVYYWDGVKNVLCVPHISAPEAPAQGDPLEKLTRIQEELGLYNDKPAVVQVPPIPLNIIRKWPDGFEARLQHVWKDVISFIPNVKLWDLQRVLAEFGFRMEVYDQAAAPEAPATAVVQVPQEFDYKHPRAQALIGADARHRIIIDLVWQILEDPRREFTASDMEYWDKLHDKVQEVALAAAPEAQAIPAPWREAVKVAREAGRELVAAERAYTEAQGGPWVRRNVPHATHQRLYLAWQAHHAALAQLDALEGGK